MIYSVDLTCFYDLYKQKDTILFKLSEVVFVLGIRLSLS
jgi:hypothetical protein